MPCLCMLARVGIHTIHTILSSFRLGCPWVFPHTTHVPFCGVGGLLFFICSLAVSTFWRWRLPFVLMAYRAREKGGFHVICRRVRWCGGVVRCVLLVCPWPFYPCVVCGGRLWPLHTLLVFACACGRTTCPFFLPSGLWFVCFVAVVCALRWRVAPFSRFCGFPVSYHHFFLLGLPIRYSCQFPHTTHVPFRGVGGLLPFVSSLAVSTFFSALAAYRVR